MKLIEINNATRWGAAAGFVDPVSDDPLWVQVDKNYQHGGGWRDMDGFEVVEGSFDDPYVLQWPGDPLYHEEARIRDHTDGELLALFRYSFVLWTDGTETKVARID